MSGGKLGTKKKKGLKRPNSAISYLKFVSEKGVDILVIRIHNRSPAVVLPRSTHLGMVL